MPARARFEFRLAGMIRPATCITDSSIYLPYPYNPAQSEKPKSEDERVVRGGSWSINRDLARCAYRNGVVPDYFFNLSGFV